MTDAAAKARWYYFVHNYDEPCVCRGCCDLREGNRP